MSDPLSETAWLGIRVDAVNARIRQVGACIGKNPDHATRATHIWHVKIGNQIPLCAECNGLWWGDVQAGTCEAPVKIEVLKAKGETE